MKPKKIRGIGRVAPQILPHVAGGHRTGSHKPAQPTLTTQPPLPPPPQPRILPPVPPEQLEQAKKLARRSQGAIQKILKKIEERKPAQ